MHLPVPWTHEHFGLGLSSRETYSTLLFQGPLLSFLRAPYTPSSHLAALNMAFGGVLRHSAPAHALYNDHFGLGSSSSDIYCLATVAHASMHAGSVSIWPNLVAHVVRQCTLTCLRAMPAPFYTNQLLPRLFCYRTSCMQADCAWHIMKCILCRCCAQDLGIRRVDHANKIINYIQEHYAGQLPLLTFCVEGNISAGKSTFLDYIRQGNEQLAGELEVRGGGSCGAIGLVRSCGICL